LRNHIVAIAYPEFTTLKEFCIRNNLPHHDSLESILSNHNDQVMQLIEQDMNRLAEENKFNSLEKVKGNFRLVKNEFEVGTVLTPTMKLRRNEAKKYFADLIEEIYHKATEAERLL
jgi:long-subunit acyl-CoA synthetase (AMP-forming)